MYKNGTALWLIYKIIDCNNLWWSAGIYHALVNYKTFPAVRSVLLISLPEVAVCSTLDQFEDSSEMFLSWVWVVALSPNNYTLF